MKKEDLKKLRKIFRIILCLIFFVVLSFFSSVGMKEYSNIYSVNAKTISEKEINIDSEIGIVFNQRIVFLTFENIEINPVIDFSFSLSEDGKELILKANNSFSSGTKYEVKLNNIRGISGLLLDNISFVFYTLNNEGSKALKIIGNDKQYYSDLELSKERFIVPETSRPKKEIEIIPKFTEGKYIDINIENQVMTLFEDGMKVNQFLISSGKYWMPSPLGTFSVKRKELNHWSTSYGLWMPYSMNFLGPYYIHELPYWPNGYREGENHLGVRVSHGCIRLGVGSAKYVFDWSEIGTAIYIH
ncbi:MAG: L,D-transpeptidase family protein [Candidatus Pacebacteria bacterium]|nr:L,D-transpeptidase family protein [Candidatus Paceibacterota bacterium]